MLALRLLGLLPPLTDTEALEVALCYGWIDSQKQAFDQDYFVAESAPTPGTEFYSVPTLFRPPHEALQYLNTTAYRILLKRPEKFDKGFDALLRHLFAKVVTAKSEA